jgi:hypothetical protein
MMTSPRVLLAILVLGLGMAGASAPSHAQIFEPRYSPPGGSPPPQRYRLPSGGSGEYREYVPRRQYVPEQRARPQRRGFFDRLFGLPVRPAPPSVVTRPDGLGNSGQAADNEQATPAAPRVPKTIFVAVMGDSLAENLSPGLNDAMAERPEVGLVRELRSGVGLLKENKKTWRQTADEILARDPAVAAAVIFIGPTDDAPAPPAKKDPLAGPPVATSAPWMDDYAAKVDELALAFRQRSIPLLWVGLPPVDDPKTMSEYLFLNDLVRQRVAALGGTFIDVWEGFVDEQEKFTVHGPNIEGRVVRLRTADGLHFTKAGARKIGHAVELELRTILAPKDQGDAMSDIGVDPGAPTVPGSSRILMLGMTPRTPGAVLAPPSSPAAAAKKPEFNPGIIAGPEGVAPDPSAAAKPAPPTVSDDVLVSGAAVPTKPGRADDFAWPATAAN